MASSLCTMCDGQGYHDVIVGGSETCPACEGTGTVN
ncbi:YuiA family protein [Vulcanibacillus modesticaldus]|nr:YuiA family protein [Vulcanibacillus modesticaldus]